MFIIMLDNLLHIHMKNVIFCFQPVCEERCGEVANYVHVLDDLWLSPVGFVSSHQLVLATSAFHRLQVSILCMPVCHVLFRPSDSVNLVPLARHRADI